jgi:hypothetical protein
VTPVDTSVEVDATRQFTATANWSDESQTDVTADATWTCEHEGTLATFNGDPGQLQGLAEGNTTVWAEYMTVESNHAAVEVTDNSLELQYIRLTPTIVNLNPGGTRQITAYAHWSDSSETDVTDDASWTSGNDAVAAFNDAPGNVEAVDIGETDVWCTYQSMDSGYCAVTVENQGEGVIITIEEEDVMSSPGSNYQYAVGNVNQGMIDFDADYWDLTNLGLIQHRTNRYRDMDNSEMDGYRQYFPGADRYYRQKGEEGTAAEPRYVNIDQSQLEIFGEIYLDFGNRWEFDPPVWIAYPFYEGYLDSVSTTVTDSEYPGFPFTMNWSFWGVKEGVVKNHLGEFECLLFRTVLEVEVGEETIKYLQYQWLGHDGTLLAESNGQNFSPVDYDYTSSFDLKVQELYDP